MSPPISSSSAPHKALVTAPVRGPGFDKLARLAQVVYEPWTEQDPLRIYDGPGLAKRLMAEDADILVVEADFVDATVFELPLTAVAATRGDPNNVDVGAATVAGVPVIHTPGRNADAVAELAIGLLIALARRILPADRDVREIEVFRDGTIPYQRFRGWEVAGKRAAIIGYGAVGHALEWRLQGLGHGRRRLRPLCGRRGPRARARFARGRRRFRTRRPHTGERWAVRSRGSSRGCGPGRSF